MTTQFHLALPCGNVYKTRTFYKEIIGATIGRSEVKWADVNLYGHQITFTESGPFHFDYKSYSLHGSILPAFHFGIILEAEEWDKLYARLVSKNIEIPSPVLFLENKIGTHKSFFIKDPNDYTVEFKCFSIASDVFSI